MSLARGLCFLWATIPRGLPRCARPHPRYRSAASARLVIANQRPEPASFRNAVTESSPGGNSPTQTQATSGSEIIGVTQNSIITTRRHGEKRKRWWLVGSAWRTANAESMGERIFWRKYALLPAMLVTHSKPAPTLPPFHPLFFSEPLSL